MVAEVIIPLTKGADYDPGSLDFVGALDELGRRIDELTHQVSGENLKSLTEYRAYCDILSSVTAAADRHAGSSSGN